MTALYEPYLLEGNKNDLSQVSKQVLAELKQLCNLES